MGSFLFPRPKCCLAHCTEITKGFTHSAACWEHPPGQESWKLLPLWFLKPGSDWGNCAVNLAHLGDFGSQAVGTVQTKLEVILQGPSKSSFACVKFLWRGWFFELLVGPDDKWSLLVQTSILSSQPVSGSSSLLWHKSLANCLSFSTSDPSQPLPFPKRRLVTLQLTERHQVFLEQMSSSRHYHHSVITVSNALQTSSPQILMATLWSLVLTLFLSFKGEN